jgi:hypothetical protein
MREDHRRPGHSVPPSSLGRSDGSADGRPTGARCALRNTAPTTPATLTFRKGTIRVWRSGWLAVYGFQANPAFCRRARKAWRPAGPPPISSNDLARHDVGLALLDELNTQGYPKPSLETLIQAGHHGVRADFVREMGQTRLQGPAPLRL